RTGSRRAANGRSTKTESSMARQQGRRRQTPISASVENSRQKSTKSARIPFRRCGRKGIIAGAGRGQSEDGGRQFAVGRGQSSECREQTSANERWRPAKCGQKRPKWPQGGR